MNKLIIALSLACASACVFAEPTSYDKLQFDDPINWFGAKVDNGQLALDKLAPSGVELKVEGDMLVVETDADTMEAVTLQAATEKSKDITTVTFDMIASTVPSESLKGKDAMSGKGKIAFAIAGEDDARGFWVWLGGDNWEHLIGAVAPADEAPYKLVVRFDGRQNVNKVSFEVIVGGGVGTVLKKETSATTDDDGWYSYGVVPVSSKVAIDLIGSGKIASILGVENPIKAEIIPVKDLGNLVVPEPIKKAYPDMTAAYSKCASVGNVGTAVALGIVTVDDSGNVVEKEADFTVKADAMAVGGDIPVKFVNYDGLGADGAVIKYVLFGSVDGTSFSAIDDAEFKSVDSIKIPASAVSAPSNMRYFKVQTQVEVNDSNKVD